MKQILLCLVALTIIFSSCMSEKKILSHLNKESIPADVKDPGYVLLVQKPTWSKMMIKKTTKYMQAYPGKWEFATLEECDNGKFADSTKYRYAIAKQGFQKNGKSTLVSEPARRHCG